MSTTSIKHGRFPKPSPPESHDVGSFRAAEGDAGRGWRRRETSLAWWQRLALETLVFVGLIAFAQRRLFGDFEAPGLPHPYWLPVILASCQYGMSGGMIATAVASVVYVFGLSPQSAAQDFYAYGRTVAIQPAVWLATALVLGGIRSLHIHQYTELADNLALYRRRAGDLGEGLDRATAEINALERRIAVDMSSVAALSRSLSQIDMSSRRAAAASLAELFRVGTGAGTMTVYLKEEDRYAPVWAIVEDSPRSTAVMESLSAAAIADMLVESARDGLADRAGEGRLGARRFVVAVPPGGVGVNPLAAIVGELQESQDLKPFARRAEEFGRVFATILSACPSSPRETQA